MGEKCDHHFLLLRFNIIEMIYLDSSKIISC